MRSITNVIISFFELLEAEGRSFRESAVTAVENMTVVFFALAMVFVGVAVALFSLYLWLSVHIGRVGGSAVIAAMFLISGVYLLTLAHSKALAGQPFFSRKGYEDGEAAKGEPGDAS